MSAYRELIRSCLCRVLLLVQLDRDGAARSIARELAVIAERADRDDDESVVLLAQAGIRYAETWANGREVDAARDAILRIVLHIARVLDVRLS